MWRVVPFVMSLLCLLVRGHSGADDDHNIVRWNVTEQLKNTMTFELPKTGVVFKNNKPLHIILKNFHVSPEIVSCRWGRLMHSLPYPILSESEKEAGKYNLIIKVNHVTDDMSTKWECRVFIPWMDDDKLIRHHIIFLNFKIRIKGLERVRVTVGGLELTYTQTEPSQVEYDGVAEYWYNDGEAVDLVCTRHAESNQHGYILLIYYNAVGEILFETDTFPVNYPVNFRKSLRAINNNDYVDCSYVSRTDITYTYKTIFKLKFETTSLNPLKITVNNLKLVPIRSDDIRAEYQYKFYKDQMLSITCERDRHSLGNLSLHFSNSQLKANLLSDPENVPWKATKQFYTIETLDSEYLVCVNNNSQYSTLLLLLDQTEPIIEGLTPSDVIHQYSTSTSTWVIHYQYTVNQKLNLTCVARKPNAKYQWRFINSTVESDVTSRGPTRNHLFALNEEHNGTSIVCDIIYARAIVNLHVKPDSPADYTFNEDRTLEMIVGCALAVSAVILITLYFVIWCRRRKNKGGRQEPSGNRTRERVSTPADPSHRENTSVDCIATQDESRVDYNYVYDHWIEFGESYHVYEEVM